MDVIYFLHIQIDNIFLGISRLHTLQAWPSSSEYSSRFFVKEDFFKLYSLLFSFQLRIVASLYTI